MRLILRNTFLLLLTIASVQLFAQPANDDCTGAFSVTVGADEESAIPVDGDTRGATASSTPAEVCSGSWFSDDIWFVLTVDEDIPLGSELVVRAYFDQNIIATDVPAVGMAIYGSCAADERSLRCFSSDDPADNTLRLPGGECLGTGSTYYVRVWSGGSPTDNSGTLAVGAFVEPSSDDESTILWQETFSEGLGDWTTEGLGVCRVSADSSVNAVWKYYPDGFMDEGSFQSGRIASSSFCDGAVGVDSDFLDNLGDALNEDGTLNNAAFGTGPVPVLGGSEADYELRSPAIFVGDYNVAGITLRFTEMRRQYLSEYFYSYRSKNTGDDVWGPWNDGSGDFTIDGLIPINEDAVINEGVITSTQRYFMPGAADFDSLQIRFLYRANYYIWAIDDVQLVETEANNMRAQSNWYATAPYAVVPANQTQPFHGMIDIYNKGARTQTNVNVNYQVVQDATQKVIYSEDLGYGSIGPDSIAENKVFPGAVFLPAEMGLYTGTYNVFSDSTDFDPTDNAISYSFRLSGPTEYAHETGATRSVAVAGGIYDDGAPLSYAYGNVFSCPNGSQLEVTDISWGVSNPEEMAGYTVNIVLYDWVDQNGNEIVEFDERTILGLAEYTFVGDEGSGTILTTPIENFEEPDDPVTLRDGGVYLAMVEYQANTADDPQFFLLASEAVDYNPVKFAMDSAFIKGWVDHRTYITCLGFSADGIIAGIDYEVTELDVNDTRIFFGNDIVALVRLNLREAGTTGTEDILSEENVIKTFPNPASELLNIQLQLESVFDRVDLNVYDMSGQLILSKTLNGIQNQVERLDVRTLPSGTYTLRVVTEEGQRAKPFVVQH